MEKEVISTTAEILMHHLQATGAGMLDEVIADYTAESVLMSPDQTFRGSDEIKAFFQSALAAFPPGAMDGAVILHQEIDGEVAYIVWKLEPYIKMATDTFIVRSGKIAVQTFLMVS